MIRPMTYEEETNLAGAIIARSCFGMDAGVQFADKCGLPCDLIDLVRAGADLREDEDENYVFILPVAEGQH